MSYRNLQEAHKLLEGQVKTLQDETEKRRKKKQEKRDRRQREGATLSCGGKRAKRITDSDQYRQETITDALESDNESILTQPMDLMDPFSF